MNTAHRTHSHLTTWGGLAGWVGLCLAIGGIGALATTPEIPGWYRTLAKPAWTPPDAIFGPVWTMLYILMGVAAWQVWRNGSGRSKRRAIAVFLVQLGLNLAWSWIFFHLHQPGWAFFEILILWGMIVVTVIAFSRISALAGGLLVPYLTWVTFAAYLNLSIWRLN